LGNTLYGLRSSSKSKYISCSSGRGIASIGSTVSCSNCKENTGGNKVVTSLIQSSRCTTTQRHVGSISVGLSILCYPVYSSNDTGSSSGSLAIQDLNCHNSGAFGDTVGASCNCACNVSAVTIAVSGLLSSNKVCTLTSSVSSKLGVGNQDTGINDKGFSTSTIGFGVILVGIVLGATRSGNSGEIPNGTALGFT